MTPFAIFFLRQFFLGISREVEEAARIDGAGHFRIFFRVVVPMSSAPDHHAVHPDVRRRPGANTSGRCWCAQDQNSAPLTVALGIFRSQTPNGAPDWPGLMAMTLLAALPIMILFAIFGRKVVNSIQFSGIK